MNRCIPIARSKKEISLFHSTRKRQLTPPGKLGSMRSLPVGRNSSGKRNSSPPLKTNLPLEFPFGFSGRDKQGSFPPTAAGLIDKKHLSCFGHRARNSLRNPDLRTKSDRKISSHPWPTGRTLRGNAKDPSRHSGKPKLHNEKPSFPKQREKSSHVLRANTPKESEPNAPDTFFSLSPRSFDKSKL